MITNLQSEITPYLQKAKRIYIATALINIQGHDFLIKTINKNCVSHYLIGIDLPSHPDVLENLMLADPSKIQAKIYKTGITYHPKVYIIETLDNNWTAFVGSANTTNGGLNSNVEMSIRVTDSTQCKELFKWFDQLYKQGSVMDQTFIDNYRHSYLKMKARQAANRSDLIKISKDLKPSIPIPNTSTDQFFKDLHFEAYEEKYWEDYSDATNNKRKAVKERFKKLNNQILPKFGDYGLTNINKHPNTVSSHRYLRGFTRKTLDAMWIHYGYTIGGDSMLNHPRLQVILRGHKIGVWLLIGMDHGSVYEREQIKNNLQSSTYYKDLFFQLTKDLGGEYYVSVSNDDVSVDDFKRPEDLANYILSDQTDKYLIISREFEQNDPAISETNISETVLEEFQRLFPLYDLIRDKR